jgi:hypothetical protein
MRANFVDNIKEAESFTKRLNLPNCHLQLSPQNSYYESLVKRSVNQARNVQIY